MMVAAVTNSAVTAIFVASTNHIMSSGDIQLSWQSETVCVPKKYVYGRVRSFLFLPQ